MLNQTGKTLQGRVNWNGRCAPAFLRVKRCSGTILAAVLCVLFCSRAALGQCQYAIVEPIIQGPNCQHVGPRPTIPLGMNNLGEAVGYYWDCNDVNINHAFLWKPGEGLTTLPNPPGVTTAFASDINDAGYIIGGHWRTGIGWSGFIRDPHTGEYTYLEALHEGFTVIQTVSTANAINNASPPAVAGSRVVTKPGESPLLTQAVIWWPYGEDGQGKSTVVDLGTMGFGPKSAASDLNDDLSSIVGWTGGGVLEQFPFDASINGSFDVADQLLGVNYGGAHGATNIGRVVGAANFSQGNRAFIWDSGKLTAIEPLPDLSSSFAAGANDIGQVHVVSRTGSFFVPGVWQHGQLTNLTEIVVTPEGVTIGRGRAINNEGQFLASARLNGKDIGVVMTPVDVPVADLNADCTIDVHDLLLLLNQWGPCDCSADLTGDRRVGVPDLLVMLVNWGSR